MLWCSQNFFHFLFAQLLLMRNTLQLTSKHLKGHLAPRVSDVTFLLKGHFGPHVSDVAFLLMDRNYFFGGPNLTDILSMKT